MILNLSNVLADIVMAINTARNPHSKLEPHRNEHCSGSAGSKGSTTYWMFGLGWEMANNSCCVRSGPLAGNYITFPVYLSREKQHLVYPKSQIGMSSALITVGPMSKQHQISFAAIWQRVESHVQVSLQWHF